MNHNKFSGILCHITSLPTPFGIGDFGPSAYEFIDNLSAAGQSYWQILPIGNTDDSGCPYATDSAFGCAEFYVSPEFLSKDYGLEKNFLKQYFLKTEKVNFEIARKNKRIILEEAYKNFLPNQKFKNFLLQEKDWLEDYCQFRTFSETRGPFWRKWSKEDLSAQEKKRVKFHQFCQYICFTQMANLKKYANDKNILLVGDLPIFVSYNSMDVWKNPEQFYLNKDLEMEYEAGAAPDVFSVIGQKWGTPIYDWQHQKKTDYKWWNDRLSFCKRYFDVIRIDHFRGFCATWISKVTDPDATLGHWYNGPGADLFNHLKETPEIIAEDLGKITADVDNLRDLFNFPTMKVFQFMLGDANNPHKLYRYIYNSVAYSGTHDCDTLIGWFRSLNHFEKEYVEHEIKIHNPNHWDMLKVLMKTPSRIVLIQIQDLFGAGSEARFNYPGTVKDANWTWKLKLEDYMAIDWTKLLNMTKDSGREQVRTI